MADAKAVLTNAINQLYEVFGAYKRPANVSPCRYCWTEEELEYFRVTPLRRLEPQKTEQLIRETGDHWQDAEAYKYYLPRILEVLAPPTEAEDLYAEHLFEVLNHHQFKKWPSSERDSILAYVHAVAGPLSEISPDDGQEWIKAAGALET